MTKDELISKLRASGDDAVVKIRSVPESAWGEGRYENGWNARQILAHVASIEWTYPRLIDLVRPSSTGGATAQPATSPAAAASTPTSSAAASTTPPSRPMSGGVNSYNDRQVEKRSGATVEELVAEFQKNRAATIAAFGSVDETLFSAQIQSAGGVTGTLADVLNVLAIAHVQGHVADMVGKKTTS